MSKSRAYCFTWFGDWEHTELNQEHMDQLKERVGAAYQVCQLERCPETSRLHLQGYWYFAYARTMTGILAQLNLSPAPSLRVARGNALQNKTYCTKSESRELGPWEAGEMPAQGARSDISSFCESIATIGLKRAIDESPATFVKYSRGLREYALHITKVSADKSFVPRENILCVGETRSGKSRWAREQCEGTDYYVQPSGDWFDGYEGETTVIFDDYGAGKLFTLDQLLRITDNYCDYRVPVKGSHVPWTATKLIFTTNRHPSKWYNTEGREEEYKALGKRFSEIRIFHTGCSPTVTRDRDEIDNWW